MKKYIFSIFVCIFLVSSLYLFAEIWHWLRNTEPIYLSRVKNRLTVPFMTMIITGIGTLSILIAAWLNEERNVKEANLKIEKLELEIAELREKAEEKKPKIHLK